MNEDKTYYTGDAIEAQFEICTNTTNVEDISTSQIVELYDIMGRLIDTRNTFTENRLVRNNIFVSTIRNDVHTIDALPNNFCLL